MAAEYDENKYKEVSMEQRVKDGQTVREEREKKALVAWSNTFLAQRELKAATLQDYKDGVLLVNLLEICFNKKLGKYNTRPKMPILKLENVGLCFAFLKENGVRLISIDTHDVVAGHDKPIIIILWNILRNLLIRGLGLGQEAAGEETGDQKGGGLRSRLLEWCQQTFTNVDIQDFWNSFKDGLSFCAIVDNLVPGKIDMASLSRADGEKNLDLAFTVAESELGIPRLLDAQDFADGKKPDEASVMNYLSMLLSTAQSDSKKRALEAELQAQKLEAKRAMEEERNAAAAAAIQERERLEAKAREVRELGLAMEQTEAKRKADEARFREEQATLQRSMEEARAKIEAEQARAREYERLRQLEMEAEQKRRLEEQAAYEKLQQDMASAAKLTELEHAKNMALEEDTKQLQEAYAALQADAGALQEAHVQLQAGTKKLRDAYVALQGKKDELQEKHIATQAELKGLQTQFLQAQENITELRQTWEASEAALHATSTKLGAAMDDSNELRAQLAAALDKLAKAETRESVLKGRVQQLEEQMAAAAEKAQKEYFQLQAELYATYRDHEEVMARVTLEKSQAHESSEAPTGVREIMSMDEKVAMAIREKKSQTDFISTMKNMEGYLSRRRPNAVFHKGRFKKVYFRLEGLKLSYYKDHVNIKDKKGTFALADYKEAQPTSNIPGHFTFRLIPKEGKDNGENNVLELRGAVKRAVDPRASILAKAQEDYFAPQGGVAVKREDDDFEIKRWMAELNRRIGIDTYLREVNKGKQSVCNEILDFVCDDEKVELRVDDKMVGVHSAIVSLKLALKHRHNLHTICLRNVSLTDPQLNAITDVIKVNMNIENVVLTDNLISHQGAVFLAEALKLNHSLKVLDLNNNQLKDEGVEEIGKALGYHPSLTRLNLAGNGITDVGAVALVEGLRASAVTNFHKPHRFPVMFLRYNLIGNKGAKAIAQLCVENRSIHTVDLAYNNVSDEGVEALCTVLSTGQTSIDVIDLEHNAVSTKGMLAMNQAMSHVDTELTVNFSNNNLIARKGVFALVNNTALQMDYPLFSVKKIGHAVFDPSDTAELDYEARVAEAMRAAREAPIRTESLSLPGGLGAQLALTQEDEDFDSEDEGTDKKKQAAKQSQIGPGITISLPGKK